MKELKNKINNIIVYTLFIKKLNKCFYYVIIKSNFTILVQSFYKYNI